MKNRDSSHRLLYNYCTRSDKIIFSKSVNAKSQVNIELSI